MFSAPIGFLRGSAPAFLFAFSFLGIVSPLETYMRNAGLVDPGTSIWGSAPFGFLGLVIGSITALWAWAMIGNMADNKHTSSLPYVLGVIAGIFVGLPVGAYGGIYFDTALTCGVTAECLGY